MKQQQSGIALLEAMLATLILAIGLLGTVGMQARAYSAMADASMRAEATIAAEKLLGLMNNDQANLTLYALAPGAGADPRLQAWLAETRSAIPNAVIGIAISTPAAAGSSSQVDITIQWTRKDKGVQNTHALTAYIAPS